LPYSDISYRKSVKEVYRDVILGFIYLYVSVDVIFRRFSSSYERTIDNSLSWVPDWAVLPKRRTTLLSPASFISESKASGGRAVWKGSSEDPNKLRIVGKPHDEVVWVAEPRIWGHRNARPPLYSAKGSGKTLG
jgi:hypothetical protein